MDRAVIELFEDRARDRGSEPLALFSDAGALTAPDLLRLADRAAARLLHEGIAGGSRVFLLFRTGPRLLASFVACWRIGAIACPVDAAIHPAELARRARRFGAAVVLIDPALADRTALTRAVREAGVPALFADIEGWPAADVAPAFPHPDDGAVCIFTSGSTASPKGVLLSHANLLNGARNVIAAKQVGAGDRVLCVLPLSHVNGLVTTFLTPVVSGGSVVFLQRPFEARQALTLIDRHRCTWFSGVPTHYALMMRPPLPRDAWSLASLRFCRSASAPLPSRLRQDFEEHYGVPIIDTMGMTESAGQILSNPLPPETRKAGSVGRPVGFDARVVREDGRLAGPDEVGELHVRGPASMVGYLDDPEETAAALTNGWLRTGDLVRRDSDDHYTVVGRKKDIAIFSGANISLPALDRALGDLGLVQEAACVGEEHPIFGELVVLYAVPNGSDDLSRLVVRLSEAVYPLLPNRRALGQVRLVERIPRSSAGKVLKSQLREVTPIWPGRRAETAPSRS
jgi:long-chain acyl-CoA synthetase